MKAVKAHALRRKTEAVSAPIRRVSRDTTIPNNETSTMRILEIFDRSGSDHSLKPLDQAELMALEAILFEKNDRLYFRRPVRN